MSRSSARLGDWPGERACHTVTSRSYNYSFISCLSAVTTLRKWWGYFNNLKLFWYEQHPKVNIWTLLSGSVKNFSPVRSQAAQPGFILCSQGQSWSSDPLVIYLLSCEIPDMCRPSLSSPACWTKGVAHASMDSAHSAAPPPSPQRDFPRLQLVSQVGRNIYISLSPSS